MMLADILLVGAFSHSLLYILFPLLPRTMIQFEHKMGQNWVPLSLDHSYQTWITICGQVFNVDPDRNPEFRCAARRSLRHHQDGWEQSQQEDYQGLSPKQPAGRPGYHIA